MNNRLIIVQNRSKGLWSTDQGCVDVGPECAMVVRPGDSCFEYLGLSRNYLGATMLHVEPFFPPFSLVQNRTGYFSASFSPLRCSALQPPLQCTASAPAVHCIRPCKYVFFYRVCISPKPYLDSLWPIWHVSSVAQIHAQPISVGFERF